jgi:creatinase
MPRLFSDEEFKARLDALRQGMARDGFEVALVTSVHNIMYLTGFWHGQPYGRYAAAVIPMSGEPVLISPRIEAVRARDFTWMEDVRDYSDEEPTIAGSMRLAADVLSERMLSRARIGIEHDAIPVALVSALQALLPDVRLGDVSDALERLRLVKSAEEIALTRKLAHLCDVAMGGFDAAIVENATEIEIAAAAEDAMRRQFPGLFPDLEYCRGRTTFRGGPRLWGHHDPVARPLRQGDLTFQSAHPIVMGYFSTLARQRFIGPIPDAVRRAFDLATEASDRCTAAMRPGVTFAEIDRIALRVFEKADMAQYKGFGTGHSHGLMGPFWGREKSGELRPYNQTVLAEGVITSMEPSVFVPGIGMVFTNDMILVTKNGAEVITHYPRDLRRVD